MIGVVLHDVLTVVVPCLVAWDGLRRLLIYRARQIQARADLRLLEQRVEEYERKTMEAVKNLSVHTYEAFDRIGARELATELAPPNFRRTA